MIILPVTLHPAPEESLVKQGRVVKSAMKVIRLASDGLGWRPTRGTSPQQAIH